VTGDEDEVIDFPISTEEDIQTVQELQRIQQEIQRVQEDVDIQIPLPIDDQDEDIQDGDWQDYLNALDDIFDEDEDDDDIFAFGRKYGFYSKEQGTIELKKSLMDRLKLLEFLSTGHYSINPYLKVKKVQRVQRLKRVYYQMESIRLLKYVMGLKINIKANLSLVSFIYDTYTYLQGPLVKQGALVETESYFVTDFLMYLIFKQTLKKYYYRVVTMAEYFIHLHNSMNTDRAEHMSLKLRSKFTSKRIITYLYKNFFAHRNHRYWKNERNQIIKIVSQYNTMYYSIWSSFKSISNLRGKDNKEINLLLVDIVNILKKPTDVFAQNKFLNDYKKYAADIKNSRMDTIKFITDFHKVIFRVYNLNNLRYVRNIETYIVLLSEDHSLHNPEINNKEIVLAYTSSVWIQWLKSIKRKNQKKKIG
jgi:hypothetical protein